jgi:predicted dehydrogenase
MTELIDDPAIDVVYNPLPNGLHYEWTLKSLKAGKHVLLEKPSVSNAAEASSLFRHPLVLSPQNGKPLVLLEAFHSRFHPAFESFLTLVKQGGGEVETAEASLRLFKGMFPLSDIRFSYELAGGSVMDPGTYLILALRLLMGREPKECVETRIEKMPEGFDGRVDRGMKVAWSFGDGRRGEIDTHLSASGGYWFSWLTGGLPRFTGLLPTVRAVLREVMVPDGNLVEGEEHLLVKTVTMWNFIAPHLWHRIDILNKHTIRNKNTKAVIRSWEEKESKKAYTWTETGNTGKGEEWWSTYRCQLEAFVDRIKTRTKAGEGAWIDGEESIAQMQMIDGAYARSGLGVRPTSDFKL